MIKKGGCSRKRINNHRNGESSILLRAQRVACVDHRRMMYGAPREIKMEMEKPQNVRVRKGL